ncbi:MAG: shikimate dehydrogenase [Bacteroidota bacterium]
MNTEVSFGLIGGHLKNTFSKDYFNHKFAQYKQPFYYENFQLDSIEAFNKLLKSNENLRGLNVTIPFKESIIPYLHKLDNSAAVVGAVNCIKITKTNNQTQLVGYNTDVFGFQQSLQNFIPLNEPLKALIIGTGGAAKAVAYVCNLLKIDFLLVTHNREKVNTNTIHINQLNEALVHEYKLIINCTPLGMFPLVDDYPKIPYGAISGEHYCFDLIYLPEQTLFLQKASAQGAAIKNGLEMLQEQANKAYEIFMA